MKIKLHSLIAYLLVHNSRLGNDFQSTRIKENKKINTNNKHYSKKNRIVKTPTLRVIKKQKKT